jgi:Sec-independent protein translocase protein TatA
VGFGAEILFILLLGLLVLGPKRLHTVLADVARAKARFEEASRGFKSQLTAELEADSQGPGPHIVSSGEPCRVMRLPNALEYDGSAPILEADSAQYANPVYEEGPVTDRRRP